MRPASSRSLPNSSLAETSARNPTLSLAPGDVILEEPRARAVHLQPVQHIPLLERPGRRMETGGVDRQQPGAPAAVEPRFPRRLALHDERAKVAMQHRAGG